VRLTYNRDEVAATKTALAVLAAATLAVAGCGGGSKNPPATTPPLTKQSFLAQVNAVCTFYQGKQNQVRFPSANPIAADTSPTDRAKYGLAMKQIVQLGRQELGALRKLEAPEALRAGFAQLVAGLDASFTSVARVADAAKRNRPEEVKSAGAAARKQIGKSAALANRLGAKACA
jgi:hypothetical protein